MSYRDWHVGMKVVFVPKGYYQRGGYGDEQRPVAGCVYTIRALSIQDGVPALQLREVVNAPREYSTDCGVVIAEPWFACCNFRRVQPRATDISIFTAMLNRAPAKEPA